MRQVWQENQKEIVMKFVIRHSINHKFYFILKAKNGETIATSEMYDTKQACRKGIAATKKSFFAKVIDLAI